MKRRKMIDINSFVTDYYNKNKAKIDSIMRNEATFKNRANINLNTRYYSKGSLKADLDDLVDSLSDPNKVELRKAKREAINRIVPKNNLPGGLRSLNLLMGEHALGNDYKVISSGKVDVSRIQNYWGNALEGDIDYYFRIKKSHLVLAHIRVQPYEDSSYEEFYAYIDERDIV